MKHSSLWQAAKSDLRLVPGVLTSWFCISVVIMNLLANKIIFEADFIAADGGILVSWAAFLCMDIVTKAFGHRTANTLSFFAMATNLFVCLIFYAVSIIPTETDYSAFNTTIGSTWFIVLSSSTAFMASAVVNNTLNTAIGRFFRNNPDGKAAYMTRSYISTFTGQFIDNLIFAVLVFMIFAPVFWGQAYSLTFFQCLGSAVLGAVLELMMEIIFSPIGYMVLKRWRQESVIPAGREETAV